MYTFRPRVLFSLSLGFAALIGTAAISGCHKATSDNIPPALIPDNSGPDPADANMAPVDSNQPPPAAPARVLGVRSPAAPRQTQEQYPQQNQDQNQQDQQQYAPPPLDQNQDQNYGNDPNYAYNAPNYDGDDQVDAGQQAIEESDQPPPPLPEYEQPEAPAPNYLWTPGYWGWVNTGFFWVPGVWCAPPYYGALWTPPYWGFYGRRYLLHRGFWGRHIGFYGGINYGHGYNGDGYHGGYWNGRNFYYNRAVNRINTTRITNVYNRTVINNTTVNNTTINNRVSYNGGRGGVNRRP